MEPALLKFSVSRNQLACLTSLFFVRSDVDADDYWSVVKHCQGGGTNGGYDVAVGPVSQNSDVRLSWSRYDQISFHSDTACSVLDASAKSEIRL